MMFARFAAFDPTWLCIGAFILLLAASCTFSPAPA